MADKGYNIDDPQNLNSFLALIGGSQVSSSAGRGHGPTPQQAPSVSSVEPERTSNTSLVSFSLSTFAYDENGAKIKQDQDASEPNSRSQSVSASPARGTKAPPSTPAAGALPSNPTVAPLERIEEDGTDVLRTIASSSNLNLNDSIYAPRNSQGRQFSSTDVKYATMPTRRGPGLPLGNFVAALQEKKPTNSLSEKSEHVEPITQYQDNVIEKFLEAKCSGVARELGSQPESVSVMKDRNTNPTFPASTDKVTQTTIDSQEQATTTGDSVKSEVTVAAEDAKGDHDGEGQEQDRMNLKHFETWGTPTPRTRPNARVRKIILNNLPADSDLTLVQSLVYGGAIESFNLAPSKTSAYVTFVTADACDAFFSAHPNGIAFKNPKTRRNHVVFVDRGKDVDVVSSVLQAYLDCQASRVVRATGADEDWGMRALYKLAESKNRRIETIVDTYRDKVRTIIFRFTNIADGVSFRGQLMRDEDWEMCNIQFMDDPAEKAIGVHLDD